MTVKRIFIVLVIAMAVGVAFIAVVVIADEWKIGRIRPYVPAETVTKILGWPDEDFAPVPMNFAFGPSGACRRPAERLLVYHRGTFRKSVLIYLDGSGRVTCIERRGYLIIGH
jgi:hypothetical protein